MSRDPYRYYRIEARELIEGLATGVMGLASAGTNAEAVGRLLRQAHTLKGAARVVRETATADRAHRFEALLEPLREGRGVLAREDSGALLQLVDGMRSDLDALGQVPPPVPATPPANPAPAASTAEARPAAAAPAPVATPAPERAPAAMRFDTVRIEVEELDRLLEEVTLASIRVEHMRSELGELHAVPRALRLASAGNATRTAALATTLDTGVRGLADGVDQSARHLLGVQERIHALRLLPVGEVFASLERAVYDVAGALEKSVRFVATGGEHKLEAHVLAPLSDALLHVVRNAVDHGIESAAERAAAGKPAQGRIELSVQPRGGMVAVIAQDDGRGIDVESVRRKALAQGRLDAAQAAALDADGIIALLLRGGLSTKSQASDISGRGIGLDAVRDVAERLKGRLDVHSQAGRGTRIEIQVPASLSRLPALLLRAGTQVYSIPLTAVERALRVSRGDVAHSGEGETVMVGGQVLPFARLGALLGAGVAREGERSSALLLQSRNGRAVVAVDRLLGQAEILLRPLPPDLGALDLFMGASLDANGDPQPMLDADGLVAAALRGRGGLAPVAPRARSRILVIDDSLTTRMLEQSILESAGFEVALATSGEEGLAMARQRRYDLFITDVEMPGMNGFEFISATRADPALRDTPGIVVSSLHSDADKARGAQVGARAYIVKGEFEQGRFLDTVRSLVD